MIRGSIKKIITIIIIGLVFSNTYARKESFVLNSSIFLLSTTEETNSVNRKSPAEPNKPESKKPTEDKTNEPDKNEKNKNKEENKKALTPADAAYYNKKADYFFKNFVDEKGLVDYSKLKMKSNKFNLLKAEYAKLKREDYKKWNENEKLSFWINLYNIEIMDIVTSKYPIKASRLLLVFWPPTDIRHIRGLFTDYKFLVMDEEFNLRSVERNIINNEFDEPRAFLAMSQATKSGPPLKQSAYFAENLKKQLNQQSERFLSSEKNLEIDIIDQIVHLSAIFDPDWMGERFIEKYGIKRKFKEFEPAERAVLNFITNYISYGETRFLETGNYRIDYLKYDWRLNDAP